MLFQVNLLKNRRSEIKLKVTVNSIYLLPLVSDSVMCTIDIPVLEHAVPKGVVTFPLSNFKILSLVDYL